MKAPLLLLFPTLEECAREYMAHECDDKGEVWLEYINQVQDDKFVLFACIVCSSQTITTKRMDALDLSIKCLPYCLILQNYNYQTDGRIKLVY